MRARKRQENENRRLPAISELPWRPGTQSCSVNEAQNIRTNMNQLPLENIFAAAKMDSPHSARGVAVCKWPLDQFASLLQQSLSVVPFDSPPIRVHRLLFLCLAIPLAGGSFRFRNIAACLGLCDRQHHLIAVIALIGDYLRECIQAHLRFLFR